MYFYILSVLASALAVSGAPTAAATGSISTYGVNGSGCPPGSTDTSLSSDKSTLTAVFSQFTPSVSTASFRQNCQATLQVSVPAGKQFTLSNVKYDGYVQLSSQVSAVHQSTYYFQAQTNQKTSSATLNGPIVNNVDLSNSFDGAIWSACGSDSIINVDISVFLDTASNSANGFASVDSAKIGPFTWRDC